MGVSGGRVVRGGCVRRWLVRSGCVRMWGSEEWVCWEVGST